MKAGRDEFRIRVLIVDDEPLAREGLKILLAEDPAVEVVGECGDGASATEAIEELKPDLVFLDVQMPEADGFSAIPDVKAGLPLVIFVTAYEKHAIRAFEVHALDYLLKPFDDERFAEALARAKRRMREKRDTALAERMSALLAVRNGDARRTVTASPEDGGERHGSGERGEVSSAETPDDEETARLERFIVRRSGRVFFLDARDVDWIEAADYYVRLHVGDESHLLRKTMKGLERSLDPELFVRIHRSTIVRLDFVRELRPDGTGDYSVILGDGTKLSLSRSGRKRLEETLGQTL